MGRSPKRPSAPVIGASRSSFEATAVNVWGQARRDTNVRLHGFPICERNSQGKRMRGGRDMRKQDLVFDYDRYRRLLADAVDERKRLALIRLLIEERAMDRLAAQRASDRAAMTATTVSQVLSAARR